MPEKQKATASQNPSTPPSGNDGIAAKAGQAQSDPAVVSKAEQEGQDALSAAKKAADDALAAATADPSNTALAEKAAQAEQISRAIESLVTPPEKLSDEELIAIAQREKRINAGLGVVAAITGALYALHKVLTDRTFQALLNEDMPEAVRNAMTKGLSTVLQKLGPLFSAFKKFQQPDLRDNINNLFDAGVDIAYALVELSDEQAQESARKNADNIALTMGLIKKGGPLVLACINLVECCLAALARDEAKSNLTEETKKVGEPIFKALQARAVQRERDHQKNVEEGKKLLEAQRSKLLTAGTGG